MENQLSKPLLRIFEPILKDKTESVLLSKEYRFATAFVCLFAHLILEGEHTLTKTIIHSKIGGLMAFTKRTETCLSCKTLLPDTQATCAHCKPKEAELYQRQVEK